MILSQQEGLSLFSYAPERFKESLLHIYLPTGYKTPSTVLIFFSKLLLFWHVHSAYDNAQSIRAPLTAIVYITTSEHSNEIASGLALKLKLCKLAMSPGYVRHSLSKNTGKYQ